MYSFISRGRAKNSLRRIITPISNRRENSSLTLPSGEYPFRWLRDSCLSPESIHPSTRQKLHRTSDVLKDASPARVHVSPEGVDIDWKSGHKSFYPTAYLETYASPDKLAAFHKDGAPILWDRNTISATADLFSTTYTSLREERGLLRAITQLERYGLCFIKGVPNVETSTEKCELRKVAQMFGEIRNTFYGELWDVKNVRNSRNIAYTNLDLGLHMDLLYFQHPPRYQFLHCLRNRVTGGMSIFVDALYAANKLRSTHPAYFHTLATTPVSFHYINDGHHLHNDHPTIELSYFPDPTDGSLPVKFVNYSPPFQAPLRVSTPPDFYDALEKFVEILEDPANKFEYTLQEGDIVVFDNRRTLHARTAFSVSGDEQGEGGVIDRWLKGCYIEADSVLDKARVLRGKP